MTMATRAQRPIAYRTYLECGWRWGLRRGADTPHLVHPNTDMTLCHRVLTRGERTPVSTGIHAFGCRQCKQMAGLA